MWVPVGGCDIVPGRRSEEHMFHATEDEREQSENSVYGSSGLQHNKAVHCILYESGNKVPV